MQAARPLQKALLADLTPYLAALLATGFMACVRFGLEPTLRSQYPLILFVFSVGFSVRYFGWKSAVFALIVGFATAVLCFMRRGQPWTENENYVMETVIYFFVSGTVILLLESEKSLGRHASPPAQTLADKNARPSGPELKNAHEALSAQLARSVQEVADTKALLQKESASRKQAEAQARHFAAIVTSSEDAIIGIGLDEAITDWNLGAERLLGYGADVVVGKKLGDFLRPKAREEVRALIAKVQKGERVDPFDTYWHRKEGKEVPVWIRVSPIIENDQLVGISAISRDLTYTKRLEEQVRQSAKMEAIGRLAGGVAHEFNNMLTAIIGHADILRADCRLPETCHKDVNAIIQAAERAAQRTRQLLAYGRKQILQPKVLDLNSVVQEAQQLFRPSLGENVRLITHLAGDLGRIRADPFQVEQVIVNLATNAADAMPQGGTLTIKTANVDLECAQVEALSMTPAAGFHDGPWVLLEITDTGRGIDAKLRKHIFEPFFSTKEFAKATGLGLATVYGIVRQSGGYVDVDSALGKGTTFRVYLPLRGSRPATPVKKAPAAPAPLPGGSETILLVEDDDMVRRFALALLKMSGYSVLEAHEATEAMKVSSQHAGQIHLLVTDVVMPGMNGRELAEKLTQSRGDMKVLFMSGYTEDAVLRLGIDKKETAFLPKPFTPGALAQKVRDVLGQSAKLEPSHH